MSKKRDLFAEMMQGIEEMAAHREGKITLRSDTYERKPAPDVSAQEIVALRERLHMSQNVFARRIRTSASTLRNWEQEKSKPNAQAALLIKLVEKFPDMVERLNAV
ncbi:helix-turn-helix domain-containing protein [Pseudomonas abietaniphila]|jgi:putative transcriptional regulator